MMTWEQQLAYLRAWALDAKTTAGMPELGAAIDAALERLEPKTVPADELADELEDFRAWRDRTASTFPLDDMSDEPRLLEAFNAAFILGFTRARLALSITAQGKPECCGGCGAPASERALDWQLHGVWCCIDCYNERRAK